MTIASDAGVLLPFTYGRGYPTLKEPPNPAAGTTFTQQVPGGRMYRLITARAILTTSAAVANRVPRLLLTDNDGLEYARVSHTAARTASTTTPLFWAMGLGHFSLGADGNAEMPFPDILIQPGHNIVMDVSGMDVGDTLTAVRLYWEEIPVGGIGYPTGIQPTFPPLVQ